MFCVIIHISFYHVRDKMLYTLQYTYDRAPSLASFCLGKFKSAGFPPGGLFPRYLAMQRLLLSAMGSTIVRGLVSDWLFFSGGLYGVHTVDQSGQYISIRI